MGKTSNIISRITAGARVGIIWPRTTTTTKTSVRITKQPRHR